MEYNKADYIGMAVTLSVIIAFICGGLECLGVNTGVVGGICALIPMVALVIIFIYNFIRDIFG